MHGLKANWKSIVIGFGAGLAGVCVALLIWHAWLDHKALHQIIDLINANIAQAAKAGKQ